jgi:hypothetical protein
LVSGRSFKTMQLESTEPFYSTRTRGWGEE